MGTPHQTGRKEGEGHVNTDILASIVYFSITYGVHVPMRARGERERAPHKVL